MGYNKCSCGYVFEIGCKCVDGIHNGKCELCKDFNALGIILLAILTVCILVSGLPSKIHVFWIGVYTLLWILISNMVVKIRNAIFSRGFSSPRIYPNNIR